MIGQYDSVIVLRYLLGNSWRNVLTANVGGATRLSASAVEAAIPPMVSVTGA